MNNFTIVWRAKKIIKQWESFLIPRTKNNHRKYQWSKLICKNNSITVKE